MEGKVHAVFYLTGILWVILPFAFLKVWRSKRPLVVSQFVWGVIAWCFAAVLFSVFNGMFGSSVLSWIVEKLPDHQNAVNILYIGLLLTMVETSMLLLVLLRGGMTNDWNRAVSLGMGYGFIEMVIYGLAWIAAIVLVNFFPEKIESSKLLTDYFKMPWQTFLAPVVERCFIFLTHLYAIVLIAYAIRRERWVYLIWAFIYKLSFYSLIAYGWINYGYKSLMTDIKVTWNIELAIVAFGGLGLAGLLYLGYGYMAMDREIKESEEKKSEEKKAGEEKSKKESVGGDDGTGEAAGGEGVA